MPNPRFLQTAERWKNKEIPIKKKQQTKISLTKTNFSDNVKESFIFSYDGPHKDYFQELIAKSNEKFKGTRAEIPIGKKGEVRNMHAVKRMALISTIINNPNLRGYNLLPITPMQSEYLLKEGKLSHPENNWEDLALLLYDTNGENQEEAQALKEDIIKHRNELGLNKTDLENKIVIVGTGAESDESMNYGIKPIIIPGTTLVYPCEILNRTGENHNFEGYGLDKGLPSISQIGNGKRTLNMPSGDNIGLRLLYRYGDLGLSARSRDLADPSVSGRVNFARSASPKN